MAASATRAGSWLRRRADALLVALLAFICTSMWGCDTESNASESTRSTSGTTSYETSTTTEPTTLPEPTLTGCLCIFDIDRTLTGKQSETDRCPGNEVQPGVRDTAYSGGTLTLSLLAQGLGSTFCSDCYISTISAGDASGDGSPERQVLHEKLSVVPGRLPTTAWSHCSPVTSPLVVGCPDGSKQHAVPGIIAWFLKHADVKIADDNVHFFDDRVSNVKPFAGYPYNARQIACEKRDMNGAIGLCGATLDEIQQTMGAWVCEPGKDSVVQYFPSGQGGLPI